MAKKPNPEGTTLVAEHRRAKFDYTVDEALEAGIMLTGSEVKSIRNGTVQLADAYALPNKSGELFLHNMQIAAINQAAFFNHEPLRARKLLLHRVEIDRWASKVRERGYSIIPLQLYFKNGKAKVQLGLCKGKTHEDRREDIKERETRREMERATRRR